MKRLILPALLLISALSGSAQNTRTQVLVLGDRDAAVGAALQAAESGVKTILLTNKQEFTMSNLDNFSASGLEAALFQRLRAYNAITDSTANVALDQKSINAVVKMWMDSTKNLTVLTNTRWLRIERAGNGWQVKLADGSNLRSNVLVNGLQEDLNNELKYDTLTVARPLDYNATNYRTSVAGFMRNGRPMVVDQFALIHPKEDNLVIANALDANIAIGQAAGVIAAYGPFFSVKTAQTKLKVAQGEVLAYKQNIIPVTDVNHTDQQWRAIQNLLQTGIIKNILTDNNAQFMPERLIAMDEIRQPVRDYFYKSQIWFEDHPQAIGTLEEIVNLIAYTRIKSVENTLQEIEKKWALSYGFKAPYDPKKVLTRRQFAAITYDYFQLDQVNVDKTGKVIR